MESWKYLRPCLAHVPEHCIVLSSDEIRLSGIMAVYSGISRNVTEACLYVSFPSNWNRIAWWNIPGLSPACPSGKSNMKMKMNMEHCWNVTDRGRPKYWEKNLSQFQFVHYKSHLILELEVKEKYQIEITNRFAALENLDVDEDVIGLGKTLKRISKPQLKRA